MLLKTFRSSIPKLLFVRGSLREKAASPHHISSQPNHHHNMTVKYFIQLLFILLYSCSSNLVKTDFGKGEKQFGFHIENGPRQGFQYFDSTKTEYNYRYYTITITNDTIVPILLQINFDKTDILVNDSIKSKIFLLPRHLTPDKQHFDQTMPKELIRFLDVEIDPPQKLIKTLKQSEKCVLTFGVLTDTKYSDPTTPYGTEILTSDENSPVISMKLKINDRLIIPCGKISYIIN